jgi:hypothetical protein
MNALSCAKVPGASTASKDAKLMLIDSLIMSSICSSQRWRDTISPLAQAQPVTDKSPQDRGRLPPGGATSVARLLAEIDRWGLVVKVLGFSTQE